MSSRSLAAVAVGDVERRARAAARAAAERSAQSAGSPDAPGCGRGCCIARRTRRATAAGVSAHAASASSALPLALGRARRRSARLAQRGVDQRVGHPQRDALDLAIARGPRCPSGSRTARCRRRPTARGAAGRALPAGSVGASGAIACSRMRTRWPRRYGSSSSRPARSSAHCSSASCAAARICGSNSLKRGKVCTNSSCTRSRPSGWSDASARTGPSELSIDRGDQRAAAREVAVGGGARHLRARRDLGDRGDVAALLDQRHRRCRAAAEGRRLDAALGRRRRLAELVLEAGHAGLSGARERGRRL